MPEPRVEPTIAEVIKETLGRDAHNQGAINYLLARLKLLEARVREMEERRG